MEYKDLVSEGKQLVVYLREVKVKISELAIKAHEEFGVRYAVFANDIGIKRTTLADIIRDYRILKSLDIEFEDASQAFAKVSSLRRYGVFNMEGDNTELFNKFKEKNNYLFYRKNLNQLKRDIKKGKVDFEIYEELRLVCEEITELLNQKEVA